MATITTSTGSPGTVSGASGGRTYSFNAINTTPQQVLAGNPSRQKATFHNPGSVDIFIAPVNVLNTAGSDTALTPSPSALGGCIRVYGNGGTLVLDGECQKAYQAFSASGSGLPLTVIESNV